MFYSYVVLYFMCLIKWLTIYNHFTCTYNWNYLQIDNSDILNLLFEKPSQSHPSSQFGLKAITTRLELNHGPSCQSFITNETPMSVASSNTKPTGIRKTCFFFCFGCEWTNIDVRSGNFSFHFIKVLQSSLLWFRAWR